MNLNLKSNCKECSIAKEKKKARLDQERLDAENNEVHDHDVEASEEDDEIEEGFKRGDSKAEEKNRRKSHALSLSTFYSI